MATLKVSKQGQQRIRQARNDKGWIVDDPRWLVEASKILEPHRNWEVESPPFASGVSEGTWKAFLYRQRGIEAEVFKAYCKVLGLPWEEIREATHEFAISHKNFDWHQICREMLESQKRSIRRQATEIVSEPFYVQLGLVDRKHQPRRSSDFSLPPEQGSGFFQLGEEEIIKTYEHDEFLEQVIKQGQTKKSQGKRIAIIGEPGAGKTTLLEAIAFCQNLPYLPIWISLGSLGEKSLEEYLCQKWLKDALKTSDVTQQQKALEELFKSGEVLLLLDGVDEMPAPSPVEALAKIREELTGWVADARVVLTCRVNVWDASVNALQGFDTYRTLEFSYGDGNKPDQVKEFICQWFSNTDKPELGEPLRKKLDEDRHQRIRDLVKNPLRLSLLCQSWYFLQGDLPETKAALYEQFTRAFYEWKEEQFSTSPTKRKELNAALGLLAREAIDKEKSRFGIRESFALDVMEEDLFNVASKLHWLVHIYNDADTGEKVYAFFHPTFQEYFAACAIDDWDYFLNHNNENPDPFLKYNGKDCVYRVFEQQWKEVILLWLGRNNVKKYKKEAFIRILVEFDDGCWNLYSYQAYFLASAGITEFKDCSLSDEIIELTINSVVGHSEEEDEKKDPVVQAAWAALQESDRSRVIPALLNWLSISQDKDISLPTIRMLGQIAEGKPEVITALTTLLHNSQDKDTRLEAAKSLVKIDPDDSEAVLTIVRERMRYFLAIKKRNGCLKPDTVSALIDLLYTKKANAIQALTQLLQNTQDTDTILAVAHILGQIDPSNLDAITALNKLLVNSQDEDIRSQAAINLGSIDSGNLDAVNTLIELVLHTQAQDYILGVLSVVSGNINTVMTRTLVEVLETSQNRDSCHRAIFVLGEIGTGYSEAVTPLVKLLRASKDENLCYIAIKSLGKIGFDNPDAITILIEVLRTSQDKYIYWEAIESLGKIAFGEPEAITALIEILYTKHDGCINRVADSLSKISGGNLEAVTALITLLHSGVDIGYNALWYCAKNTPYAAFYRTWHGEPSAIVQALENKLIDIPSKVQPTDKTYPITLDTQSLKLETNISAIAQKLCTKIYRKAGYSEIPTVSDAAQLQQYIPRIQEKLQKQNLALILHGCEPNEHLINFCYSFADPDIGLYIGLITSQPIEQPLKGFLPNQDNLLSAIQSWISEIG